MTKVINNDELNARGIVTCNKQNSKRGQRGQNLGLTEIVQCQSDLSEVSLYLFWFFVLDWHMLKLCERNHISEVSVNGQRRQILMVF